MPYKHSEQLIPQELKRNVKLTDDDKEEIRRLYKLGGWSWRTLAIEFGVHKSTINFVLNPERQKKSYALRVANGGSKQYYIKEKHTETMKKHRRHKQKLKLKGLLDDR